MHFCDYRSGRFVMLVSMSDKELKRLSVLQEICDQRITQTQAAQLLHISERQIRRLLQKYKAQGPVALAGILDLTQSSIQMDGGVMMALLILALTNI